jgi:hypothetical protein
VSNPDSFPKPNTSAPEGSRPSAAPRVNAPVRPQQRPAAPASALRTASRQPPASVPSRVNGRRRDRPRRAPLRDRLSPASVRYRAHPASAPPRARPGLVKPAPKAKVRRARLLVSKVDPWSVLKMAFLLSVALGIVTVVAAIVLWTVLDLTGIFDQVDSLLGTLAGSEGGGFELKKVASLGQVASFATIIAVVNVVLLTALSMLSAVLYNIAATLVGGIGVTLTDD